MPTWATIAGFTLLAVLVALLLGYCSRSLEGAPLVGGSPPPGSWSQVTQTPSSPAPAGGAPARTTTTTTWTSTSTPATDSTVTSTAGSPSPSRSVPAVPAAPPTAVPTAGTATTGPMASPSAPRRSVTPRGAPQTGGGSTAFGVDVPWVLAGIALLLLAAWAAVTAVRPAQRR